MKSFDSDLLFYANQPYPPICVEEENCTYAKYILDNIGGHNSEMTAISFYYSNSIRLNLPYSHIFKKINQVEMHHLEIFGKLATQLGETSLLWTNCGQRKVWWSPSYADYPCSIVKILDAAHQGERSAIEKYQWQMERIHDENVRENLQRIIEDEKIHASIFKELLENESCK